MAKPPGSPTVPETEFKVLPILSQEHFQPEEARNDGVFVADLGWSPASGPIVGMGMSIALNGTGRASTTSDLRGGCGSFFDGLQGGMVVMARAVEQQQWLAREVFEMAEAHRQAGDWDEAKRWYAGVQKLYPTSSFAKLAGERLDRLALLRIAAEAGEEQSEEPPIADWLGSEILRVMPREVK
ncbi:MAG: hypothetical protein K8T89_05085 [Planctomycetes bacterium]|nr:hypothetical protein [Planctomycetota bacterium]